jgi:MFS transporter, ACS family, L-galactonate transporter
VLAAYTSSVTMAVVYISLAMFFINLASAAGWTMISVAVPKRQVASLGSIQNFGGGDISPALSLL